MYDTLCCNININYNGMHQVHARSRQPVGSVLAVQWLSRRVPWQRKVCCWQRTINPLRCAGRPMHRQQRVLRQLVLSPAGWAVQARWDGCRWIMHVADHWAGKDDCTWLPGNGPKIYCKVQSRRRYWRCPFPDSLAGVCSQPCLCDQGRWRLPVGCIDAHTAFVLSVISVKFGLDLGFIVEF